MAEARRCDFPACGYRPAAEYDGAPYCAIHLPPAAPCPTCGGADWRRSVWTGWACRDCLPAMGRRLPVEYAEVAVPVVRRRTVQPEPQPEREPRRRERATTERAQLAMWEV